MNFIHATPFISLQYILIFHSHLLVGLPRALFPPDVLAKYSMYFSPLPHTHHVLRPFPFPSFGRPNNIWWEVEIILLFIMKGSLRKTEINHEKPLSSFEPGTFLIQIGKFLSWLSLLCVLNFSVNHWKTLSSFEPGTFLTQMRKSLSRLSLLCVLNFSVNH